MKIWSLPALYKRTSNGKIEQWHVRVEEWKDDGCWAIVTKYGHVDGKLQEATESVTEGKNLGKANATTAEQQAKLQAQAEWTTKLTRKGYVEDLKKAEAGENSGAGGIRPMLAKSYDDHAAKIVFPCYAQPKLDGIRCIAVVEAGGVTLWSREQKPITAVPHINAAIQALGLMPGTVLDGELYNHDLKDDFEKIVSAVRKQSADPDLAQMVQYHIYDLPRHPVGLGANFGYRSQGLKNVAHHYGFDSSCLKIVETVSMASPELLLTYREWCQRGGYEGAMARNDTPYEEGKRSYGLQKLKEFLEEEFEIVGVEEGVGKMAGLAIFVCKTEGGNEFRCKMEGELEGLRKYVQDPALAIGKKLTVKYFSLTNKSKVPRFPVGKAIRDYE